jgi:DNA end-binding protein Ku
MARAIWSGAISFGLVNIPVKLFSAVKDTGIHFHMLHQGDGTRVRQQLYCPHDEKVVPRSEVEKGYEVEPGRYVIVSDEELEGLAPRAGRTIEISDFVEISTIDPIYFRHPYYLVPEEEARKAYGLLVRAMGESSRIGIGRFVMRGKEYLAAIRPYEGMIVLETMHFAEEIVRRSEIEDMPEPASPGERELKMAGQLIEMLAADFEPGKYRDAYREDVRGLIETRAAGEQYVMPPPVAEEAEVVDLMSALEKSLERAREHKSGKAAGAKKKKAS